MNKTFLINTLIQVILQFASSEVMKTVVDGLLDIVEDAVAQSGTKVDDMIVLPVVKQVREVFDVPDDI